MKRPLLAIVLLVVCGSHAAAQNPAGRVANAQVPNVLTPDTVTPEMWYYSQELQRYDDPGQAVRRKAELVSQQRAQRIASMKWFGKSNSRPQASALPWMGVYSPTWIGNGADRYDWVGAGHSTAVYASPTIVWR